MTKLYRVEAYVLDLNDDCPTKESVIENIECNRHPEFISIEDVQETDVGEWDDDHELNQIGCNYRKFFPEFNSSPNDTPLKKEYYRVRSIMLAQLEKNSRLETENRELRRELESLKKVKEFVKTIGELTK